MSTRIFPFNCGMAMSLHLPAFFIIKITKSFSNVSFGGMSRDEQMGNGLPSLKLTARTWKCMLEIQVPFSNGLFSSATGMLVAGSVTTTGSRWWSHTLFIFIPTWGNDPIWQAYVSNGLVQPPTRFHMLHTDNPPTKQRITSGDLEPQEKPQFPRSPWILCGIIQVRFPSFLLYHPIRIRPVWKIYCFFVKRKLLPTISLKLRIILFFEIRPKHWCKKGNSWNFQTPGKPSALFLRQELLVLGVKLPKEIGHLAFQASNFQLQTLRLWNYDVTLQTGFSWFLRTLKPWWVQKSHGLKTGSDRNGSISAGPTAMAAFPFQLYKDKGSCWKENLTWVKQAYMPSIFA